MILDVVQGGGAAAAGLRGTVVGETNVTQLGDIIQKVGGHDVANMNDLLEALEHFEVGDAVEVEFLRDGDSQSVDVTLN